MVAAGAIQILQFCYDCRRRCPDSARMFWENLRHFPRIMQLYPPEALPQMMQGDSEAVF